MALIADYGGLQTAVTEWLWRTGDAQVQGRADAFIALFEARFARKRRTLEMQEIDTAPIFSAVLPLPTGYLETIRLQIVATPGATPTQKLDLVTADRASVLDKSAGITNGSSGVSKFYTLLAGQIVITPQVWAPVGSFAELSYYRFTQLKDATGGTNWLLAKHPDIYLYGALMQAAAYIDDKETVALWKEGLDEALEELDAADKRARRTSGPLVMTPSMSFRR